MIRKHGHPDDRILDAGGGSSNLAGHLWNAGFHRVTVVDISSKGLARARRRLGTSGPRIRWLRRDLAIPTSLGPCEVWHDRAVFHFLVRRSERVAYLENLKKALVPGGVAIIATFAPDGPAVCSGLSVHRYAPAELAEEFGNEFELIGHRRERHRTPWGAVQPFAYAVLRRGVERGKVRGSPPA
jgi:SAM-dependent methyltransferase